MTAEGGTGSGWADATLHATDVIELHLLLPARQVSALRAAALRSELTVDDLLRRTIGEFLRPPPPARGDGQ
jgi:hypothetical protein